MIKIKKLSIEETREIKGGAVSGAYLSGIASIIDASTNLLTGVGGLAYTFINGSGHDKTEVKFGKNTSINWTDSNSSNNYIPNMKPTQNINSNSFEIYSENIDI